MNDVAPDIPDELVLIKRREVCRFWTIQDVMELFNLSKSAVRGLMKKGLPHVYLGGSQQLLRFIPASVEAWAKEQEIVVSKS